MTTRLLHILGIDDSDTVKVLQLTPLLRPSNLVYTGNVEVLNLLKDPRLKLDTVVCGGMRATDLKVAIPDVILCAICDPDTNAKSLDVAEKIIATLGKPTLNHPAAVRKTGRDRIPRMLGRVPGVVVPRTVRFRPKRAADVARLTSSGAIRLPFLMRPAGAHGGLGLARVDSADDLEVLDAFALDGRPYYATEYRDFRSPDGLYRKHRVIVVGGTPHARHVIISDSWNIHSESRDVLMAADAALRAEEEQFLATFDPAAWPMFERFASLLELDYFGVDYGIDADGKMVVFEVNACVRAMVGGVETAYHAATLAAIKADLVGHIERRAAAET